MLILFIIILISFLIILYLFQNKCENFDNNNIHDKYYKCSARYSMLIGNCQ